MTKVICDLRKFLHKAQVRLTQAGSLIIGYLRKADKCMCINELGNFYFQNMATTGFPPRLFCEN